MLPCLQVVQVSRISLYLATVLLLSRHNIISFLESITLGGKLSFADFLDVMHTHSKKEKVPQEIIDAFDAMDPRKTGQIATRDLKHILTQWGEHLDGKEVENLLNEAHVSHRQTINYHDLIRVICAPVPDY